MKKCFLVISYELIAPYGCPSLGVIDFEMGIVLNAKFLFKFFILYLFKIYFILFIIIIDDILDLNYFQIFLGLKEMRYYQKKPVLPFRAF